ncbi:MAG: hypothetical protein ACNA8W_26475 [Bradymonadaceae bacterium]
MTRILIVLATALILMACKTSGPAENAAPDTEPRLEELTPANETAPTDDELAAETEYVDDADPACPPPEEPEGMCIQVIAWAKDPRTGICCQYPTPCHAPESWTTFTSEEECEEA